MPRAIVAQENLSQGTGMNAISLAAIRSWQAAGLQAGASQANVLQANVPQANVPSLLSSLAASQQCGPPRPVVSSGFRSLDQLLPAGGVRRGSLVEWLADDAAGAVALAAAVACRLAVSQTFEQSPPRAATIVVVDRGTRFHPPAVMPWLETGAAPAGSGSGRSVLRPQLVVARPSRDDDELWAIDQSLRCPGVAAVLAWPRRVHPTAMRRWQLAAKAGGAVGLLVRPQAAQQESSWAAARVRVSGATEGVGTDSLSLRRLHLALVGGPWLGAGHMEERTADLVLDLARGCDAALPERDRSLQQGAVRREGGTACRAS